jgi:uncharacterized damage-inducible protein DinB
MLIEISKHLFRRELDRLKHELEAYRDERNIWRIDQGIANSAGNLCLHLVGNLNTFIGADLGHTGYVRQRELEFSTKDVPRSELIAMLEATQTMLDQVFDTLTPADLEREFPKLILDKNRPAGFTLMHLLAHLNYHLGQVNYHRRLLDAR